MPLFSMKKSNQYKELDKPENLVKTQYNENFAYCNAVEDLFYCISVRKDNMRMINRSYPTRSKDVDTLVLYAIKQALISLNLLCNGKEVTIYSIYSLEQIENFSKIENTADMKRYQSLRILEELENFSKVNFKPVLCPYENILKLAKEMELNDKVKL